MQGGRRAARPHTQCSALPTYTLYPPSLGGVHRADCTLCTGRVGVCTGARRRRTTLFFRGAHGTDPGAQAVRARAWALRELRSDGIVVDIKYSSPVD